MATAATFNFGRTYGALHTWKIHPVSLRRTCCKYNKTTPNAHAAAAKENGGGVQIARNNFFYSCMQATHQPPTGDGTSGAAYIYGEKKHIRITAALKAQKAADRRAPAVVESTPISLGARTAREEILRAALVADRTKQIKGGAQKERAEY